MGLRRDHTRLVPALRREMSCLGEFLNTALFFGYTKLITIVLFVVTGLAFLTASMNIYTMARRLDREDRALWPKQD